MQLLSPWACRMRPLSESLGLKIYLGPALFRLAFLDLGSRVQGSLCCVLKFGLRITALCANVQSSWFKDIYGLGLRTVCVTI